MTIATAGYLLNANAERHLKSPEEMARLFERWPHAISATREFADALNFSLDELRYEYPRETVPEGRTPQQHLEHLTWEGAHERWGERIPYKVLTQLNHELKLIEKLDFARYFLTVHDIVAFARSLDPPILCQGRGSAANSAVCYCLGITAVDPATSDLLFERFISEERREPPDIDVDFEHERREEVIQHIYDKYGRDRAGIAATIIHYRPRSAVREVGKVMGLSEDVCAAIASNYWGSMEAEVAEDRARDAGLDMNDPHLKRTMKLAEQLIGMPRHLSQHVGGFILTERPLTETVPIGNGAMEDRTFIEWDKDDIEELGILKIDVLALGMLTCIRKCFDLIEEHHDERWELATVPQEVPEVYDMLCRGDSLGVFQVESRAQMNMLPRLKPRCFYDLVIEVAIVRPGPIQGDMVHPYLKRRSGKEPVTFPCPDPAHGEPDELEKILGRTLGVPIFQEQAMKIALDAAKFSSEEANQLRKAMATFRSRGNIEVLQDKMVGRMVERGYDPDFAQRCFDQIKGFGEYGFPESHAASFAHLVYVSSWLRWKYPAAFACGLLNSQPMGFYAPAQIVRDAREHGVEVREVDVNHSEWDCTLEDGALRLGLRQIEGLHREAADRLAAAQALWKRRGSSQPWRRACACDPPAGGRRRVPLDEPRSAGRAMGRAGAQAGSGPALVRGCRCPGRRRGDGARAPARNAFGRACRERLSDHPPQPEGAPDALPARALCAREVHHGRPVARSPRREARVDGGAGADPPAAGQRERRLLHHPGGRDRHRQSRHMAGRLRHAAQDRHGCAAYGRAWDHPEGRGRRRDPCRRAQAGGPQPHAAPPERGGDAFDAQPRRRRRKLAPARKPPSAGRRNHPQVRDFH